MSSLSLNDLNIRHAAGRIYLIDSERSTFPYHRPVVINKVGEEIFLLLTSGKSVDEAADIMAQEYGADRSEIVSDIMDFVNGVGKGYVEWK